MNIHIEMPSGARSIGYERVGNEAVKAVASVAEQLSQWPNFVAYVVMTDEVGDEVYRRYIENA